MAADQFSRLENEYYSLKGQLATGRITKAQFEESLRQLVIQDAQGRNWILGVDDGKWYVNDGKTWVRAEPYPGKAPVVQASPVSAAPAKTNWIAYIALALGGVILLCLGIGVGVLIVTNMGQGRAPVASNFPTPFIYPSPIIFPTVAQPPTQTPAPSSTATHTPTVTPTFTPTSTPTVTPRPLTNCSDPNARWENIVDGQTIQPLQAFIGTATSENFAGYVVEWLRPGNVLHRSGTPVVHGQLFVWDTNTVPNGAYQVALIVVLNDGTTLAPCVITVGVYH